MSNTFRLKNNCFSKHAKWYSQHVHGKKLALHAKQPSYMFLENASLIYHHKQTMYVALSAKATQSSKWIRPEDRGGRQMAPPRVTTQSGGSTSTLCLFPPLLPESSYTLSRVWESTPRQRAIIVEFFAEMEERKSFTAIDTIQF